MPARFLRPRSLALLEYMAQRAVRPDARATTAAMTALEARGEWVLALRLLARLGHAADRVAWTGLLDTRTTEMRKCPAIRTHHIKQIPPPKLPAGFGLLR